MASRKSFQQNLKAAAKRRAKRKRDADVYSAPSAEDSPSQNSRTIAFDCVLESFQRWSQEWVVATDSDVASALRECLTGRSASTQAAQSLVTRWTQDRLDAIKSEDKVRGSDIQTALNDLAQQAESHRSTQNPRSFIDFLSTLLT